MEGGEWRVEGGEWRVESVVGHRTIDALPYNISPALSVSAAVYLSACVSMSLSLSLWHRTVLKVAHLPFIRYLLEQEVYPAMPVALAS